MPETFATKSALREHPRAAANGTHEDEPRMTPEELAFMRSLGWEENADDAAGIEAIRLWRLTQPMQANVSRVLLKFYFPAAGTKAT